MGSIWEGLKSGAKALVNPGPGKYVAGGRPVQCPHYDADSFIEGSALSTATAIRLLNLDGETTLMCDNCGLVQWFGKPPQRLCMTTTKQLA